MRPGDRSLFPDLQARAYLNHAAVGPLPVPARDAFVEAAGMQASHGVGAIVQLMERAHRVRPLLADLTAAQPDQVALLGSTSDGVTAVAACTPWRPGDRVVLFRGEFPTNTTPWQVAAAQHGLQVVWLDAEAYAHDVDQALADLARELAKGVRMVALSAVQFQTGLRMPLARIASLAHDAGAEVLVDAIQGMGVVPVTLEHADWIATGGQKWLMGPVGTGALIGRHAAWDALLPRLASWLSHVDPISFLIAGPGALSYDRPLQTGPASIEGGTCNLAGHAALAASLDLLATLGQPAVFAHIERYLDALETGLHTRGFTSLRHPDPALRSGILSAWAPPTHTAFTMADALRERGVSVSTPDGHLRFSPSWPNPLAEVELVLDAIDDVLAS